MLALLRCKTLADVQRCINEIGPSAVLNHQVSAEAAGGIVVEVELLGKYASTMRDYAGVDAAIHPGSHRKVVSGRLKARAHRYHVSNELHPACATLHVGFESSDSLDLDSITKVEQAVRYAIQTQLRQFEAEQSHLEVRSISP